MKLRFLKVSLPRLMMLIATVFGLALDNFSDVLPTDLIDESTSEFGHILEPFANLKHVDKNISAAFLLDDEAVNDGAKSDRDVQSTNECLTSYSGPQPHRIATPSAYDNLYQRPTETPDLLAVKLHDISIRQTLWQSPGRLCACMRLSLPPPHLFTHQTYA